MILYSAAHRGFYDTAIHRDTPSDAVEVDPVDYRALMDAQANGRLIAPDEAGQPQAIDRPDPTLEDVEADCLRRIDAAASRARARFISEGVGQSAVYLTKYEEARAYKAATDPVDSDYPYLNNEASRRGMTVANLADEVIATRNGWTDPAGATIEAERVGGKGDVRAASDESGKRTAADDAIAALDAITP